MMDAEVLKQVIFEQREACTMTGTTIERDAFPQAALDAPEALIISGIRRCGKSTLLRQIRERREEKDFYLNFDDERLVRFSVDDFQKLHEIFIELFGEQHSFYFDEIQNVEGWERSVRRLVDAGEKVFIAGSNASMLSRELGTRLTGRFVRHELFPFSFAEFLRLRGSEPKRSAAGTLNVRTTAARGALKQELGEYLRLGGIPQYVASGNDDFLKLLYESIVYRDVLVRNKFSNERELLELALFLASNAAKRFSYVSLAKAVGLKDSGTAQAYVCALENAYLVSQVRKFDFSVKKQIANTKKIYFADPALIRKIGFNATRNEGPIFENVVFNELQRRGTEIFYHAGKHECDFVLRRGTEITDAIQASVSLADAETREREIAGLLDALTAYNLGEGTIITFDEESEFSESGKTVRVRPLWKWLLGA